MEVVVLLLGDKMIRFMLKELIAEHEFVNAKRITLDQISRSTGIHKVTLSRISSQRGYNTTTENISKLCEYFGCKVDKVMVYVPNKDVDSL
jgi:putative transcriptional regulator